MTPELDVLVVGAGPIGLTLACQLLRAGLSVRLIEKRSGPSVHSKAIGLQYRVSEILARMGIVDRFIAAGGSPTTVNIYARAKRLVRLQFTAPRGVSGTDAFGPRAILLPQSQTESILIDHYRELGGTVEWNAELEGFTQDSEGVRSRVQRAGGVENVDARWLVSCEGAHSTVRRQANIAFRGKSYPLAFFMADVRMEGALSHTENHVWLHPDGSLAALPLPEDSTWRLFVEVTAQRPQRQDDISVEQIQRFMADRAPGLDARIVGEPLWLSDFRINCRMVDRMHDGRVFLAGDAAHIHSPTGGQGITTGMQDAANLAWKLARVAGGAPTALLDTYDEERMPHAAEVLRETDRTTTLLFAPNRALRLLRDGLVLPILRRTWFQRRMFGKLSQLHVHYRRSGLCAEHGRRVWLDRRIIRAGDRAPDVSFLETRSGSRTTLFGLLTGLRPLLLFNGLEAPRQWCDRLRLLDIDAFAVAQTSRTRDGSAPDLVDINGDFARLYGFRAAFLCLIRPDAHVGLVQISPDANRLREYLTLICAPAQLRRALAW